MSLESSFPNLSVDGFEVTSPASLDYNCIAWAAGEDDRWWWPEGDAFWPAGTERTCAVRAFIRAYATLGYEPCDSGDRERGWEKIALYAKEGCVTHAARQLPSGTWSSKLGADIDVQHAVDGLAGQLYGGIVQFLRRPARGSAPPHLRPPGLD